MNKPRRPTPALALLPALLCLCAGCAPDPEDRPETGRALTVRAQPAVEREFERRLTVQGTLEARTHAAVAARVAGNLDALWVDEGDRVEAGATRLFQIDPVGLSNAVTVAEQALAVARASQRVAEASARQARAGAKKSEADFKRYERLHKQGQVTDNEYELYDTRNLQAQAGLAVAEAQVDLALRQANQAEAALAIARKDLADALVVAPISGLVSERLAEPGEHMAVGRAVVRLYDLSRIEAAAFLPAQYYAEVAPGQTRFRLTLNGRDAGLFVVTYRSPLIDTRLRTFEIRGAVDEAAPGAVPGAMADLTLVFESRRNPGVPSAAVLVRAGRPMVFVVRDGKAAAARVTTGLQNDAWTEILDGLAAGEAVVTEGQTQLRDGEAVEILATAG